MPKTRGGSKASPSSANAVTERKRGGTVSPSMASASTVPMKHTDLFIFKAMLLRWLFENFSKDTALQLKINDFGSSWRSGIPIASLVLGLRPGSFGMEKIGLNRSENVSYILRNVSRIGYPTILQPAYFDVPSLDEHAVIAFLLTVLHNYSLGEHTSSSSPAAPSSSSSWFFGTQSACCYLQAIVTFRSLLKELKILFLSISVLALCISSFHISRLELAMLRSWYGWVRPQKSLGVFLAVDHVDMKLRC